MPKNRLSRIELLQLALQVGSYIDDVTDDVLASTTAEEAEVEAGKMDMGRDLRLKVKGVDVIDERCEELLRQLAGRLAFNVKSAL